MAGPAVRVTGLGKRFRLYHQRNQTLKQVLVHRGRGRYEDFWAVRDASFEVPVGATLGIIGENGSGKSTLLRCIAGILVADQGSVHVDGRLAALLEVGAGFHPEYSGRENIYLNGALLGLPRRYIRRVFDDIVGFAELDRFIDNPVKTYSSGMYVRLGFSIAVHLDPDILVVDEVLAVGDAAFQRRCMDRISQFRSEGRTLIFVSHGLESVRETCDTAIWLDGGRMREMGAVEPVLGQYVAEVNAREAIRLELETRARPPLPGGRAGVGVTGIRFIGPDGPATVFRTGDPFAVEISYESPQPLTGPRFFVGFVREDGVTVLTVPTDDSELEEAVLPARGVVRLAMPALPLLDGLFQVTVGIAEIRTEEWYTLLDRVYAFRVVTDQRPERGVALLGQRWELPELAPAPVRA